MKQNYKNFVPLLRIIGKIELIKPK